MGRLTPEAARARLESLMAASMKAEPRLWFHPFAEAVIDAFAEKDSITKADVLAKLEANMEGKPRLGRATSEAAIERLREDRLKKPS